MSRTIVIVGGGFSGVVLATLLLRRPHRGATRIVVVEPAAEIGRGVAYADRGHPFLLNVPAGRMSANPEAPLEFLAYARRRWPECAAEDFVPRAWYGAYLAESLERARVEAGRGVLLEIVRARATVVRRVARDAPLRVVLDDGAELRADELVLATGNPPPVRLPCTRHLTSAQGYVHDPWSGGLEFRAGERLLLIGTSLTMVDVLLAAAASGQRPAVVHALSRRGLVPPQQTAFRPDAFAGKGDAVLLAAAPSVRRLMRAVRVLAADAEQAGGDWREAVTFARNMAPALWARLPEPERRRFLRHVRTYWDVHRHRLPPVTCARIEGHRRSGWMQVHAGRLLAVDAYPSGLRVRWTPRRSEEPRELEVDRIVNCTGPDYDMRRSGDPLVRSLLDDGLAQPDSLGLGLRTGPNGALVDADGWPGPHLYCLGPLLRADYWEATAALELRGHAARLAAHLAAGRA